MTERIIVFLILGFFVFGPEVQSFWSIGPLAWYGNYIVWFGLIIACYWSRSREQDAAH